MWNILKSVGVALRLVNDNEEIDQKKEESELLKILEAEDSDGDIESEMKINNALSDLCSHRVGHVTHFNQDNNGGMIDSQYYFDIQDAPRNIQLGDRVMYTAYRKDENSVWIIKNVYAVQNDEWKINNGDSGNDIVGDRHGNENNTDDSVGINNGDIVDQNIVGKVVKRNGRQLVIEPGNYICNLDKVATSFVPIEGDWLLVKCAVEVNNESLNTEVLQIESLMPLRSRIQNGKVSHWESQFNQGIIDSEIVFSLDACDLGYIPEVGDEVIADVIESEQGMLVWRALQVFPFLEEGKRDKNRRKKKNDSEIPNEDVTKGKAMTDIVIQNEKESDLFENKSGISITENCNFGEVNLGDDKELVVYVKNETNRTHQLLSATFKSNRLKCDRNPQIKLISPNLKISGSSNREHHRPYYINGHDCTKFVFRVTPRHVGKTCEVFIWKFKGFEIGRRITFDIVDSYISDVKNSKIKRYKSNLGDITSEKIFATRNGFIVSSERKFRPAAFVPVRLGIFPVPQRLWESVLGSETSTKAERTVSVRRKIEEAMPSLSEPLNKNNYKQRWHAILYLEEIAHTVCLRQYDMPRAHFTKNGDFLVLEVPGLSEKRPSLICGDNIIIRNPCTVSMEDDVKYEGNIYRIHKNEIWVKFNKAFHDCYSGNDYEVVFSVHRVGFRRCHQAINVTFDHLLGDWLFPNCLKQSEPQIIPVDEENDSDIVTDSAKEIDESIDDNSMNYSHDKVDNESIDSNLNTTLNSPQINDVNKDSWKPNKSPRSATRLSVVERLKLSLLDNNIDNANNLSSASTTNQPENFNSNSTMNSEPNDQKYEKSINLNKLFENMSSVNKCNDELNKTLPIKTVEEIEKDFLSVKNNNSDDNSVSVKEKCDNSVTSSTSSDIDNNTNKTVQSSSEYRINNKNMAEKVTFLPWVKSVAPDIARDGLIRTVKKCCQRKIKWFNPKLNHFQKEAVKNILKGEARPLPYIIFGPPGTGKTITLVEAALQLLDLIPDSRLLIATPSNSSANLISERLIDSGSIAPGLLSRLCSFNYLNEDNQNISEKLFPYCTTAEIKVVEEDLLEFANFNRGVKSSSREVLGRHRVTVGTCVSLGVLYNMGFPQGHFTHILIDEAGQATEPELLIPLAFLDDKYGQAILAGDPMQLGPIVQSSRASEYGLQDSFLFRLLLSFPFTRDVLSFPETSGFDPRVITRLVMNYRSLPEILALPSSMFYDSSLIPQVSEVDSEEAKILLKLKDELPSRTSDDGEECEYKLPPALVFHGVRGVNYQEADSPSWFNPQEIVQVIFYINILYKIGLTPEQVGIVTPYKKQVMKIRSSLNKLEIPVPKVGSVEEFQGQERMAIILSTVRSSSTFVSHDIKHSLGFVSSPRRLNVALTRGRAIVIVLGNPHLLNSDPHWRTVLKYCIKNKSYCGCDLPPELEE